MSSSELSHISKLKGKTIKIYKKTKNRKQKSLIKLGKLENLVTMNMRLKNFYIKNREKYLKDKIEINQIKNNETVLTFATGDLGHEPKVRPIKTKP